MVVATVEPEAAAAVWCVSCISCISCVVCGVWYVVCGVSFAWLAYGHPRCDSARACSQAENRRRDGRGV